MNVNVADDLVLCRAEHPIPTHRRAMFRREILTADPPDGDFILSPTGYSWNVRRSLGNGSVQSIAAGERKKAVALASLISLAETNNTDAWETVGTGVFWLLRRFRPS